MSGPEAIPPPSKFAWILPGVAVVVLVVLAIAWFSLQGEPPASEEPGEREPTVDAPPK